ncbi:MAG: hypothetical protein PVF34_12490 [Gammaproteobacteria bacterium]
MSSTRITIRAMLSIVLFTVFFCRPAASGEWTGYIAGEGRWFPDDPAYPEQSQDTNLSFSAQPEYYTRWDNGDQSLLFVPFVRIDQNDDERTHADIRELSWLKVAEAWELRIGIRKVFWGVTESQHLVDIINQTDLVENIDGEDKLGQPMINLALINEWGTVDLFLLTGFRERTFPGEDGRLRTALPVDTDNPIYESGAKQNHVDFAARWSRFIEIWDIGVSYFYGTSRDPRFEPNGSGTALRPAYDIINQTSLDAQATIGNWLWKLELISRDGQGDRYTALTGGFEYTFVGIFDSRMDLGIVSEYLYDDRDDGATTPFENDLFMGARFTLNDIQSTELLTGFIVDLDDDGYMFNLEASRRLGDAWKLTAEIRSFANLETTDPLYSFRNDDHLQVELAWYF